MLEGQALKAITAICTCLVAMVIDFPDAVSCKQFASRGENERADQEEDDREARRCPHLSCDRSRYHIAYGMPGPGSPELVVSS